MTASPIRRRIDHLVVAASNLETGMEWARDALGVEAVEGGRHPRWRTRNALVGLGPGTYLEILVPDDAAECSANADSAPDSDVTTDSARAPELVEPAGRPFGLDRVTEPALVAWALRVPDIAAGRSSAVSRGLPVGLILGRRRERPDGSTLRWRLTNPQAVPAGGAAPFLIDWLDPEHPSASLDHPCALERLRIGMPDPSSLRSFLFEGTTSADSEPLAATLRIQESARDEISARIRTPAGRIELGGRRPE